MKSGKYNVKAQGHGASFMPMEVTLSENKIEDIKVDAKGETKGVADEVFRRLPEEIVENQTLNVDKFIKCFDPNQLYLFTAYSLLKNSENNYEKFGRVEYNLNDIENYKSIVDEIRESDSFYNSHIIVENNKVYTIDDFFKEYNEFIGKINEG